MRVEYDPRLVEEAVHLLARGDPVRWLAYRRKVDPLYDGPDREERLAGAMLDLFRRFEANRPLLEVFALVEGVERALVARSRRPGDEGADLLVGEERIFFLRLASEAFLDPEALRTFLRHEARHVTDMLDPAFGYSPDLGMHGRTRAEQELVRMRYRVLWDVAVDAVEPSPVAPERRRTQIDRAFVALDEGQRTRLMARFAEPSARTHPNLVAAARDPWKFLGESRSAGPMPGQPCPLCGFPSYDWSKDPPAEVIRKDFPDWEPALGACRQCCDLYGASVG